MAVDARSILNYQATDADHRTFAQAVHDMVLAAGGTGRLVQTADTGQANLATITRPGTNSASGYEVFRFDDTEQATLGAYVKIEYATGNAATIPAIRVTVGTGTTGAGTLTNAIVSPFLAWAGSTDTVAQTRPAFASCAEGQLVIMFGQDTTNTGRSVVVYVGRPRSTSGTRTTDGLLLNVKYHDGSLRYQQAVIRAGGGGPAISNSSTQEPGVQTRLSLSGQDDQAGADSSLFPLVYAVNGAIRFSSMFAIRSSAFAADAQQAVTVFGGSKNYRTIGNQWVVNDVSFVVPYL